MHGTSTPPVYPLKAADDSPRYRAVLPGFPVTAAVMFVTLRSLRSTIPQLPELKYRHCLGIAATVDMLASLREIAHCEFTSDSVRNLVRPRRDHGR